MNTETVYIKDRKYFHKYLSIAFSESGERFVFLNGKCHAPIPRVNFKYKFAGKWEDHSEYGSQFIVDSFEIIEARKVKKTNKLNASRNSLYRTDIAAYRHFSSI